MTAIHRGRATAAGGLAEGFYAEVLRCAPGAPLEHAGGSGEGALYAVAAWRLLVEDAIFHGDTAAQLEAWDLRVPALVGRLAGDAAAVEALWALRLAAETWEAGHAAAYRFLRERYPEAWA